MNEYVITNTELQERGLNLEDLVVDDSVISPLINNSYDNIIARICELDDTIKSKRQVIEYLGLDDDKRTSEDKIEAFKTLQYKYIYHLVYMGDTDPLDRNIDSIIVFQLGLGKINGFQKGIFRKE